jgi:hypothetical protein
MSRHLDNLQHLVVKLEARYGQEDAAVGELKAQLSVLEKLERERGSTRVAPLACPPRAGISPGASALQAQRDCSDRAPVLRPGCPRPPAAPSPREGLRRPGEAQGSHGPPPVAAADAGLVDGRLRRAQIESVAAFATYPIVTLMSTVHALQANLQVLSQRRTGDVDGLPSGQTTMPAFKEVIGWNAVEKRQAHYELDASALKRAA